MFTEKFSGAVQLPRATWVKERITPAGQAEPKLKLLGPKLAVPVGLKLNGIPGPVDELLQDIKAFGVPEMVICPDGPGQMVAEEFNVAVGGATTVIVPVAFTDPHPPVSGML